jgi:hypothetical protein
MTIWQFSEQVSRRLLAWNVLNFLVGAALTLGAPMTPDPARRRGLASQFIGWAVINIGIAVFGAWATERRRASLPNPDAPEAAAREARNLSRLLWINAGLDMLYMVGGARLQRNRKPMWSGMGSGIIFQGLFLLIFDVVHGLRVPKAGSNAR